MVNDFGKDNKLYKVPVSKEDAFQAAKNKAYLGHGTIIYAYSRRHMYDNVLGMPDINTMYTDTDSAFISFEDMEKLKLRTPIMFKSDDLGTWDIEKQVKQATLITMAPK